MTSTYDETGVMMDRTADILEDQIASAETRWGESICTAEDELLGHLLRQIAYLAGTANEALQAVYDGHSKANATGTKLDHLLSLIFPDGRQDAAYSTVTLTCTATVATTIPAGSTVKTAANVVFATDEDLVFVGAGNDTVSATCTEYGNFNVGAAELTTIVSSVYGWSEVTNVAAATPGATRESDGDYKERHTLAVSSTGKNDAASIYEAVGAVTGVIAVYVDPDTVHIVVVGGTDEAVAAAIDENITWGMTTLGDENVSVYNATMDQYATINFDRASEVPCYIKFTVETNSLFPTDGEQQIKDAISALSNWDKIKRDAVYNALYAPIYSVAGVVAVTLLKLDIVDPPTGTSDLTIDDDEYSTIDDDDIDITVT